jgi:D-alanyl-D-alanine carboxypeptidase/D-alanyl-D-alanine-endopeptidase (penicillin-binding protein 4)
LRRIVANAEVGNSTVGAIFVDVATGHVIYHTNADTLMNPASNAKLITAAAALSLLGPEYRFETALYGDVDGAVIDGPLYLRGRGDPSLTIPDLWELAAELRRTGVRVIRGDLIVDDSFFDNDTEPPAFDQQPNERSYFRAPVGALNINRNVVTVFVRPAGAAGRPGLVTVEPEGYMDITNDTMTTEAGRGSIRFSTRPGGEGTRARLWGNIPEGSRPVRQRSRIDNPSMFAGAALAEALNTLGIRLRGRVREGVMSPPVRMLAYHRSDALSSLLWIVGKFSDNFTAETVLKTMGAQRAGAGSWDRATAAVADYLAEIGLQPNEYQYTNGSGLFDANRFSPRQMATLLRAVWQDQTIRSEFIAQLATGGVDGTLRTRFREAPALRNVRAKTGTLAAVTALSGYVLAPNGRAPIAFSILVNGARGRLAHGRRLQNELAEAVAASLHSAEN